MKLKTLQVQIQHLAERKNAAVLLICDGGTTERSFGKMELLEFEEGEDNIAPIQIDDNDNYDDTDLFYEEDDEENDLCSSCDENLIAHLVQACVHRNFPSCVKKNNCQLCGCRISNNITIDLHNFD